MMSGLHAANKALICWCSDPHSRDTVVKVADVGFLSLLGSMSLTTGWTPRSTLSVIQPLILQAGFSHLVLEMLFNGIAIPAMCASADEDHPDPCKEGQIPTRRQEILERAARKNVAKNRTGLRKDIWLHHVLAVAAFFIVLRSGEFQEEATLLTAVEVTCGLPVAFGQAAKAKQLKGTRSLVLAFLMCSGFVLRVLLTSKLTIPRVLELLSAIFNRGSGAAEVVKTASGVELAGSITKPHRAILVLCSAGLTGLNLLWLGKIFGGVWKVVRRANSILRTKSELAESEGAQGKNDTKPASTKPGAGKKAS